MNYDQVISLCISVIGNQGKDMLFRIADINEDNKLIPFNYDPSLPINAENTNLIYSNPRQTQAEGTIAFWKWSVKEGYKHYSYIDSNVSWIEYIRINDISSIEELRIAFFDGLNIDFTVDHTYLIEYSSDGEAYHCIYCKSSDFRLRGDKYVLNDSIYRFDHYEISSEDIYDIRTTWLPKTNKRYYAYIELPQKSGSILVRTPANTVKQAIQKRINRCTEGFSKSDKKIISDFVKKLTDDNIVSHIADECRCTIEEAREYIGEFVKTCERYFGEDDFIDSVMLRLVEYNSEIGKKYQEAVQNEWDTQNAKLIADANIKMKQIIDALEIEREKALSELSATKKRLDDLLFECEEYEKLRSEAETKVIEIQREYTNKLKLADDIAERIRNKISTAKGDLSSFFAEYALFTGEGTAASMQAKKGSNVEIGKSINKDPEVITNLKELLENLKENLEAIGIEKAYSSALGAYLLAAYFTRVPLIIAGHGADLIINAVSATLFNKMADKVIIGNDPLFIEKIESDIVVVHNGFHRMGDFANLSKSSYTYFVSQTSEELILEPRSSYNYALPLFTEYFLTNSQIDEIYGTINNTQYNGNIKEQKPNFPDYLLPPLAYKNYKTILGIAIDLYGDITPYVIHLLTTLPIMLSLNKRDEFLELLSSSNLSDKEKIGIMKLIGEKE